MSQNRNPALEPTKDREGLKQHQESKADQSNGRESPELYLDYEELAKLEERGEDGQAAIEELLAHGGNYSFSYLDGDESEEFSDGLQDEEIEEGDSECEDEETDAMKMENEHSEEDEPTLP